MRDGWDRHRLSIQPSWVWKAGRPDGCGQRYKVLCRGGSSFVLLSNLMISASVRRNISLHRHPGGGHRWVGAPVVIIGYWVTLCRSVAGRTPFQLICRLKRLTRGGKQAVNRTDAFTGTSRITGCFGFVPVCLSLVDRK